VSLSENITAIIIALHKLPRGVGTKEEGRGLSEVGGEGSKPLLREKETAGKGIRFEELETSSFGSIYN